MGRLRPAGPGPEVLKDERKRANPALDAKSLLIEVLAHEVLTVPQDRPAALETYFRAAALRMRRTPPVQDPAGKCGPIQPDADLDAFASELDAAAALARSANLALQRKDHDRAIDLWRQVFRESFPAPAPTPALAGAAGTAGVALPAQPRPAQEPRRLLRDEPQG